MLVDRDRLRSDAPTLGCAVVFRVPGILECHDVHSGAREGTEHEVEALGEAGADHEPLRISYRTSDATEVAGEHFA